MIPSGKDDRKRIKAAMKEISTAMTKIEAQQDYIKDVCVRMDEEFDLPKAKFKKVATMYHKGNMDVVREENSDIEDLYEAAIEA